MRFEKSIEMPRGTRYGNNYYSVYSKKINRLVKLYSTLEYYNFLVLETSSEVKYFCPQPLKIDIIQEDKLKHAIFDVWVEYKDGRNEFQEVKYSKELIGNEPEAIRSQEQIRRQESWCKDNNVNFVIRTEKDIIQGPFHIQNLNVIAARVRRYTPTENAYYEPRIIQELEVNKTLSVSELIMKKLLPIGNELNHICYLYVKGTIDIDIKKRPLDSKTEVQLCQRN